MTDVTAEQANKAVRGLIRSASLLVRWYLITRENEALAHALVVVRALAERAEV